MINLGEFSIGKYWNNVIVFQDLCNSDSCLIAELEQSLVKSMFKVPNSALHEFLPQKSIYVLADLGEYYLDGLCRVCLGSIGYLES